MAKGDKSRNWWYVLEVRIPPRADDPTRVEIEREIPFQSFSDEEAQKEAEGILHEINYTTAQLEKQPAEGGSRTIVTSWSRNMCCPKCGHPLNR